MLELVRSASLEELRDRTRLEQLIANSGLGRRPPEFPAEMHRYFGGLSIWQYPTQLAPYLIELSTKEIETYCEIGLFQGGTFMFTVEYLQRFHPLRLALGIDRRLTSEVQSYAAAHAGVQLVQDWSTGEHARWAIEGLRPDLTFIDADHSEEACRGDYEMVQDISRLVGFHDIVEHTCPGVATVWKFVQGRRRWEYIEQYDGLPSTYGIGLVEH